MIPKVWVINVVLALCAVFAGKSAYSVWIQEDRSNLDVPSGTKTRPAVERRKGSGPPPLMEASYDVIEDRNLFSSDRAEYKLPDQTKEPEQPQLPGKTINLYGVVIMENTRSALIDNPDRKSGEPRNKWISVGETLGNLTVTAIEPDGIHLKEGAKEYKIPLYVKKTEKSSSPGTGTGKSKASPAVVGAEIEKPSSVPKKATPEAGAKKQDVGPGEIKTFNTPFGVVRKRSN